MWIHNQIHHEEKLEKFTEKKISLYDLLQIGTQQASLHRYPDGNICTEN